LFFLASILYIGNRRGAGFFVPCNGPNNPWKKQANSTKDQETGKSYVYGKGLVDTERAGGPLVKGVALMGCQED